MVQLMPLPLTVSCFSKIQICFTFLVPVHPEKRAVKRVYVCMLHTNMAANKERQFGLHDMLHTSLRISNITSLLSNHIDNKYPVTQCAKNYKQLSVHNCKNILSFWLTGQILDEFGSVQLRLPHKLVTSDSPTPYLMPNQECQIQASNQTNNK